ncbi:AraC family transcriptional regulator [Paenibacillus mucilaginosus 3016]|uniref:AraC family transcriptional regulator n=2 Tax=Paenibacillus mucilaginosus TaxID=61624 RepID=H6NJL8_9BACL|nr:helix-turn-helix domain-containing protein [Paenibacillus mucilaginosus]AFC29698.1 AraC family transcriptional regulator [Paenibacillus mucilaginosus 3016]AFH61880.1 AraC family transcriptional regulator [Paenibacillus mucilaginosus K02]WFA18373.1 AraC family transcriptional regulator [Paenibacillus mucilaginosus]
MTPTDTPRVPSVHLTDEPAFILNHTHRSASFNMESNHSHDSYEIYYMQSGSRYYFIKDRSYLVREGDLVLIEPSVLHRTTEAHSSEHERILINFKPEWLGSLLPAMEPDLLEAFGRVPVVRPEPKDRQRIELLLTTMLAEQSHPDEPGAGSALKLYLAELLLWLYRWRLKEQAAENGGRSEHPTSLHRKVSDIVQHINASFHEELSLQVLADRFHISPYYLCRIFKEATGFTLVEYIQRLRVHEARKLLAGTSMRITEVAGEVGFDSSTHFGRVFKAICGLSPLQYRKSIEGGGK